MNRVMTINRHAVVILSERVLSHGITKLSGSSPLWKVKTARLYESVDITGAARIFSDISINISVKRSFSMIPPYARYRASGEKSINHIVDESRAPPISGRLS